MPVPRDDAERQGRDDECQERAARDELDPDFLVLTRALGALP